MTSRSEEIFLEVFEALPRQGPGSPACTRRALSACRDLPSSARVLDLGCGSGAQTLDLAASLDGSILAIDAHPPLVDRLRSELEARGLAARVEARVGDMMALELPRESFDLAWSEGALYNVGLERALPSCAGWLRPGGYLAFTDAVWRTADPPRDVREAFAGYPGMGRVEDVLSLLETHGYAQIDHFDLPAAAWWDDYYEPMERRIQALRAKVANDPEASSVLEEIAREPEMHRRSGRHYGYTFFVAQRIRTA